MKKKRGGVLCEAKRFAKRFSSNFSIDFWSMLSVHYWTLLSEYAKMDLHIKNPILYLGVEGFGIITFIMVSYLILKIIKVI